MADRPKLWNLFNKYNKNIISLIILLLVAKFQGNIEQRTTGYGCRQNQKSQAKDCGRRLYLDPTNKLP